MMQPLIPRDWQPWLAALIAVGLVLRIVVYCLGWW
jgi:hypothetical protein